MLIHNQEKLGATPLDVSAAIVVTESRTGLTDGGHSLEADDVLVQADRLSRHKIFYAVVR